MFKIIDFVTKNAVKPRSLVFAGEKNPWEVVMDMDLIKSQLPEDFRETRPQLSKYLPFMPIQSKEQFVSLGETVTPLVRSQYFSGELGIDLYFKCEAENPTGSFKDRGSAVDISVAKELGAKAIVLASTGNMAASCACYAAAANLPCFVIVPEDVSLSKLAQVISYGGKIIQVKGNYNDAATLAHQSAEKHGFYLAGDYAFRVEGQKVAAFELIEQLNFNVPDAIVIPIGCGTNMTAYAKGFHEYQQLGLIQGMPQLIGVQSTGANAVINSYRNGWHHIEKLAKISTLASAIAVADPLDGVKALAAIRNSGGEAQDVTDREILQAKHLLSTKEGLFVESAGAATLAYLIKSAQQGRLSGKKVICVLTGDGLKDPSVVLKHAIKPPSIAPNLQAFTHLYKSSFFSSKTMSFSEHNEVLLSELPSEAELRNLLKKLFDVSYESQYIKKMHAITADILKKGKKLSFSDLQDVIQDAIKQVDEQIKLFSIVDFNVATAKDREALASVKVKLKDAFYTGCSVGVGPVDATIRALLDSCQGVFQFELDNYKVDIRSHGVDAVVYVEMQLSQAGLKSLGSAASPDIVQASLAAFEEAYNGLFLQQQQVTLS